MNVLFCIGIAMAKIAVGPRSKNFSSFFILIEQQFAYPKCQLSLSVFNPNGPSWAFATQTGH